MNKLNSKDTRRFFNSSSADATLTLEIYDAIGADMFGDGITASAVSAALNTAGQFDSITMRLNSPGGDLFEGVAICNLLKSAGKPVNVVVDGLAASAASLIAMAGDTITMGDGSMMMIHRAMAMAAGFSDDLRQTADTLDTVSASAADIYVARTGMKKDAVLDMMKAETWMSAQDAVKLGFATAVAGKAKVTNAFDLSLFKNTPVEFKIKTKEVDGEHLTADCFIYVGNADEPEQWALPWKFSTEEKTKSHLRDALARFDEDKVIPQSERPAAHEKLVKLCKEHGIDVSEPTNAYDDTIISLLLKRIDLERRR